MVRNAVKKLPRKQKALAEKLSKRTQPSALLNKNKVALVGGDNKAESQFSAVKGQLRRQGLHGRASPKRVSVCVLAAQRIRARPGLQTVLESLARYRRDRVHEVGHSPRDFYDVERDHAWVAM